MLPRRAATRCYGARWRRYHYADTAKKISLIAEKKDAPQCSATVFCC
jgi:hypothetical protein